MCYSLDMPRYIPPTIIPWTSIFILLLCVIIVILCMKLFYNQPTIIVSSPKAAPMNLNIQSGDGRYSISPEPERDWNTPPDLSRVPSSTTPFNIPTQGIPDSYQSMGIIKTGDGKLLPLFGRRCMSSRERYNYYTRTDSYNPLPLPVEIRGRDCQDQVGCPELFNGDNVKIPTTNDSGEVTIYKVRDIIR